MEDGSGDLLKSGENITSRSVVFTTHSPGSKLSRGVEKVHVVASDIRLSHVDNRSSERHLTVMVCRVLSNVSCQLGNLDFILELLFEASIQHLTLGWFETIHDVRD